MTPNLKTLTLGGPYKNVHGSFGPQRERVVGELGGSFGGNALRAVPRLLRFDFDAIVEWTKDKEK
jgi:hypothetical protein